MKYLILGLLFVPSIAFGAYAISQGGTATTSFSQGWVYSDGLNGGLDALLASSSPTVRYITATSTTATSNFAGTVQAKQINYANGRALSDSSSVLHYSIAGYLGVFNSLTDTSGDLLGYGNSLIEDFGGSFHFPISGCAGGFCQTIDSSGSAGSTGQVLSMLSSGGTSWKALSSLPGVNYLTNSGSNTYLNTGTNLEAPYFTATSTTATSTLDGNLDIHGKIANTTGTGLEIYDASTSGQIYPIFKSMPQPGNVSALELGNVDSMGSFGDTLYLNYQTLGFGVYDTNLTNYVFTINSQAAAGNTFVGINDFSPTSALTVGGDITNDFGTVQLGEGGDHSYIDKNANGTGLGVGVDPSGTFAEIDVNGNADGCDIGDSVNGLGCIIDDIGNINTVGTSTVGNGAIINTNRGNNSFQVYNTTFGNAFSANGSTDQVSTLDSVLDDGSGNAQLGGSLTSNGMESTNGLSVVIGTTQLNKTGISTSSPWATLSVSTQSQQSGKLPLFAVASTSVTVPTLFDVLGNGNVGIGTTSPYAKLSVQNSSVSTPYIFAVASSTATGQTTPFAVANNGWIVTSGTKPTVTSCGSTNSVSGNQTSGDVMLTGTLVTACTINFPNPVPPNTTLNCAINDNSTASPASITATTTSSFTAGFPTGLSSATIGWQCNASLNSNN